jgi:hypothetical protein
VNAVACLSVVCVWKQSKACLVCIWDADGQLYEISV